MMNMKQFVYLLWILIILYIFIFSLLNYKYNLDYDRYPQERYIIVNDYPRNLRHLPPSPPSRSAISTRSPIQLSAGDLPPPKSYGRPVESPDKDAMREAMGIDDIQDQGDREVNQAILNSYWEQYKNF